MHLSEGILQPSSLHYAFSFNFHFSDCKYFQTILFCGFYNKHCKRDLNDLLSNLTKLFNHSCWFSLTRSPSDHLTCGSWRIVFHDMEQAQDSASLIIKWCCNTKNRNIGVLNYLTVGNRLRSGTVGLTIKNTIVKVVGTGICPTIQPLSCLIWLTWTSLQNS